MKINIILPYQNTKEMLYIWSKEENNIDFRKDTDKANRCTLSFAATELIDYLTKLNFDVSYSDTSDTSAINIILSTDQSLPADEHYYIEPTDGGVKISSGIRTGVLYGCYELLKMQGIRWLNPNYDVIPEKAPKALIIPKEKTEYCPDMTLGRGFDFEGPLKDSTKLWLWMARNGLNLSASRPYTNAFQKKLGMIFKMGGHIFERILNPDRKTENGNSFWDEHNDWYGIGRPDRSKETALNTQFCMSNNELCDFLGGELLNLINNEWYSADRIDVWTFDTWGSTCQCENCKKLGNSTDQTLYFLSKLRSYLDNAQKENKLDHDVGLIMCSYEGTATLAPPENPVPENLKNGKDYVVYYPILRCYKHTLKDENCTRNLFYNQHLKNWKDIPIMLGEYYNVSKFEDLPVLFTKTMPEDIKYYHSLGIRGMTYMHLPMIEWGVRNLTQTLYAELSKNVNADVEKIISQYMNDRYQTQAEPMKKAYELCEKAYEYAASWRAWGEHSILYALNNWNGEKPEKPLTQEEHFKGKAIEIGEKSLNYFNSAIEIMKTCKQNYLTEFVSKDTQKISHAVNPQMLYSNGNNPVIKHLNEDLRSLLYGRDERKLMVLFLKYYDALLYDQSGDEIWNEIEKLAEDMSMRYMPLRYVNSMDNIELCCDDLLDRSQLKTLYYRALHARSKR